METNKHGNVVMKEKSRFLELRVTLEVHLLEAEGELVQEIVLEEDICVPVWIKATIAHRELQMKERHNVKGRASYIPPGHIEDSN